MRPDSTTAGRTGESIAAGFLELQGYRIVERNYRFGHLEIDLLARKGRLLAVVEVRYRSRSSRATAAATVGPAKQRDLETAAVGYIRMRGLRDLAIRFDVVAIDATADQLVLRHIPGAFPASGRYRL
jgi:putative endonuclease